MLEQTIQSDIKERQDLMLKIKTLALRYSFNEKDEQMFLNYSIPAVYAILEGFVQSAFRAYIQELNNIGLTVDIVCEPILIYHLENKFKQFREYPKNPVKKTSFFESLDQFYTEKTIDINVVVNTESNIGFDVLKKLLNAFNLKELDDYIEPRYSLSKELKKLLKIRNSLAHGQDSIVVSQEDLNNSIKLVEMLMDLVLKRIMDGFSQKSYLKNHE
jgi:hypothetical protein